GPYIPQVDYLDPWSLQPPAPLFQTPDPAQCGKLPAVRPGANTPALSANFDCVTTGAHCVDFPNQYWSSSPGATPPYLACSASSPAGSPSIYFVATQFPVPVNSNQPHS